ncbi:hypothetical protein CYJ73_21060 [Gordonia terrae]|uniref:Uncharacterized protein n=1 Tax=Gordonia terrae TaxID=2055 RepID=A0A2I1R353_9ACTN|nr:hypothetical protein [Gordonia terrae]PKZ63556.1 hypothetical protein CYJ73_21060 [Gordonia terrae]
MDHIQLALAPLAVAAQIAVLYTSWRLRGRVGSYLVSTIAVLIAAVCVTWLGSAWEALVTAVVAVISVVVGFWLAFGPGPLSTDDRPFHK